jgi:hypothetical protein
MRRFPALTSGRLNRPFAIWEPVRPGARVTGATVTLCAAKRSGSERAAEAPLGARE